MILRIDPALAGDYRAAAVVPQGNSFLPASRGWITRERTEPGHIGSPQAASVEKGEALLSLFAGDAAAFLERVIAWDGRSWNG